MLVLIPTLFSIFTEWTAWSAPPRVGVLMVWFAAAWLVVSATARQSEQVDELVGTALERRDVARSTAVQWLLHALLQPGAARIPGHYELRVFLPDDSGRLVPEYESAGSTPSEGWEPGKGATGMAWETNGLIAARGESVSDAAYGLTPEQQDRYRKLSVVVAHPIQNARGQAIGVLAVSSEQDDAFFEGEALLDFIALCDVVARVLLDIGHIGQD